ncbi:Keratin-associated protein 7-1 [Heterocephalus glaber]|uniref:Keratin-associated protein 7-1 n=1 Tax=Heterocephalus glaber TaxID=10181 RepID=G5C3M4_HETGA|nr:keratin-associated protein 7-1 [Heterocephalus glaber]EHB16135.1 Keratin-associated protein 7-1 [Heterocephalus glaber]
MTRYFCCGSYFPGYPCYGTNFQGTYRATPLNCVVPLGTPLHRAYSSRNFCLNGCSGCCYGSSFYRPWGSGSGFGYSTY